jgi:hypothetical protein
LALAAIIFVRKKPPKPVSTTVISIVSIAIALGYVWTM